MIYTFYSYKGGTGRSMALANIAKWLYLNGLRVVMIDWDLEAPGLENYFFQNEDDLELLRSQLGLIDILTSYKQQYKKLPIDSGSDLNEAKFIKILDEYLPPLEHMLFPIYQKSSRAGDDNSALWIIPSGWRSKERFPLYAKAIQSFDWSEFYSDFHGKEYFEWMRKQLLKDDVADVVLIDSRTGVTEMGGVCTQQLADVVVIFCVPNTQNLSGIIEMSESFKRKEILKARGRSLDIVIVPSRIENSEIEARNRFKKQFRQLLRKLTPKKFIEYDREFWNLKIPYIPKYAYSEKLSVGEDDSAEELVNAYKNLAYHLIFLSEEEGNLQNHFIIELNRKFKKVPITPRVFIYYSHIDGENFAKDLRAYLVEMNIPLWQDRLEIQGGRDWWLNTTEALDRVEFLVMVMTPKAIETETIRKVWRYARQKGVCVFPVKGVSYQELDYKSLPRWMRSIHIYDLDYERNKFINDLNTRCLELRVPFMVDDLPENYIQRPIEFNALIDQLLDVVKEEPLAITTSVIGAGGYGKTTLAMALCHDERIQDAYDDGILWVTLGENPIDLTEKIKNLIEVLSGQRTGFTDLKSATIHLSEFLSDRDMLIIIDDAWKQEHIQPFLQGGHRCSRLITTRNHSILPTNCMHNLINAMHTHEALSLLGYNLPDLDRQELLILSQKLGHWPLVLKLVNSFLIERVVNGGQSLSNAIAYINKRIEKYGITAFDARNSECRDQAVEGTLNVSLELLNPDERDRFDELAVFPEGNDIPLETVEKLWMHAGFDDLDTEDLCERLFQSSLLMYFDARTRMIRLHTVIRSYLRKKNEHRLPLIHARFLDSYGVDRWSELPTTEPYLWNNLAYHLADSGETNRLRNLLFDFDWLKRKLIVSDINFLISDYDYLPGDKELSTVQQTLKLSSNQLIHDNEQIAPHLLGRLKGINTPEITKLLGDATESQKGLWFNPISCSLTPPGGPLLRTFDGHQDVIIAVAISPDGQTAVSGSKDQTLKLWNLSTGKALHTLEGHTGCVTSVAISPDGQTAVSGSKDQTLKLWNLSTGKPIHTLEGHRHSVSAVAISPDGQTVISGSRDQTLKLWELSTGKPIHTLEGHRHSVSAVAISPDGQTIISGSRGQTLNLWDVSSGKRLRTLEGHSGFVNAVAISPDGQIAVSGSSDETLKVWDLSSGKTLHTLEGHRDWVTAVVITLDGKIAVSGSDDKTLMLWDLSSGKALHTLEGHTGSVSTVAISPDGQTAVSGSDDKTLKLWDLSSGNAAHTLEGHSYSVSAVAISPDSQTAVSGSWDHTLKLWDVSSGKTLRTLKGHSGVVNAVAISPDGQIAVSGSSDETLRVWDLSSGKALKALEDHSGVITTVAINSDGKTAVFGSSDRTLKVWDLSNGQTLHTIEGHSSEVTTVAISPDGKTALSGSLDKTLKLWDLSSGKALKTLEGHSHRVTAVAISPDGKTALSGSLDKTLKLWDLSSGKALKTLEGHGDQVTAVAISPDGKTAVSGSNDKSLKLWDLSSGEVITSFVGDSGIGCLAYSSTERVVIAGEVVSGNIHFLRLEGVE